MPVEQRRNMIERQDSKLSIRRQCELLDITRSVLYYASQRDRSDDLAVMRLLDEQYTRAPFYGVEKMTAVLQRMGICIGHNRVRRLLRLMGLEAVYPKPRLSLPDSQNRIYPYLLRDIRIERPDQVWAADITYIRLWQGFVYLVAIMDWFSRFVLSWELSVTLDAQFCVAALERALMMGRPEIFNTDQGSQFTSADFTGCLEKAGVSISMDGKGRVFDNIFVERLWRTVKYEDVYLKDYAGVDEARDGIGGYFEFYNNIRLHESLGYQSPAEIYFGRMLTDGTGQKAEQCVVLA
jgi:putative transposase